MRAFSPQLRCWSHQDPQLQSTAAARDETSEDTSSQRAQLLLLHSHRQGKYIGGIGGSLVMGRIQAGSETMGLI